MRAGLLDENISIWAPYNEGTAYGLSTKTDYIPTVAQTRARVQNNGGSRTTENDEIIYNFSVTFTIRAYHKINPFMRIKWRGNFYRILNIIPAERSRNEIQITAEIIND